MYQWIYQWIDEYICGSVDGWGHRLMGGWIAGSEDVSADGGQIGKSVNGSVYQ